jgi:hypothetical protein
VSEENQLGPRIGTPAEPRERNWLALGLAGIVVVVVVVVLLVLGGHAKPASTVTPINSPLDPYASNLLLDKMAMSESSNLAGGKVTYLDGVIGNRGDRTVSSVTVQVLFRNVANEVAQNETMSLNLIRSRDPYIDTEPVSAAPIAPGGQGEFRLIFDQITPDWNGAYPEVRVLQVAYK